MGMDQNELVEFLELLEAKEHDLQYNKIKAMFPDEGPYRRELYEKHVKFMTAGATFQERAFVGANRSGKTKCGGTELSYHLTGEYPAWWKGRMFLNAIEAWAVGISNQAVKEVLQQEMLGDIDDVGSGLIPRKCIIRYTKKAGVADAIETSYIRHVSGGISKLTFKSYEQGRIAFQGTKKQVIWLDEEPDDLGIYTECLTRLMDKHNPGIIYCTFTPLFGLSDVVLSFLPDGLFPISGVDARNPHKYVTNVKWQEVPHLDEKQKATILKSYSNHERLARSEGLPSLGTGTIYPYPESEVVVEPFEIPYWWPKAYAMDTGWGCTAVLWGAIDPDANVIYFYSEHYQSEAHPAIHASAIKARGEWMIGAADPAGANQSDGRRIYDIYVDEGLNLVKADKGDKEGGILTTGQFFAAGRLKIFRTCVNTLIEYRKYRRNEKGRIINKNNHAMDAMRYWCTKAIEYAALRPDPDNKSDANNSLFRDEHTGY